MRGLGAMIDASLRRLARRRWLSAAVATGALVVAVVAGLAAGGATATERDDLRAGVAGLLVLGGLIVALGLGAAALNRDAERGYLGLLAATGVGRPRVVLESLAGRLVALAAVLAVWAVAAQIASLALGLGLDGPLLVHTFAMVELLALGLLAAAAASAVVGQVASFITGAAVAVIAQAVVNLKAAADDGVIGTAEGPIRAFYAVLPRAITSPMISDLQARDVAGVAAPQIDINGNIVIVPPSGLASVLVTLVWLGIFALLAVAGFRRRTL